jgi:RNA polymerase sigma-70 factor, ECF subfamily
MNDDGLIALVATGDDSALRTLFSRHAPWLATRLRAVLPAADVEDVLQETFIAVWRGAPAYQPDSAAGAWLWGIARRQAALLLRRRGPGSVAAYYPSAADDPQAADLAEAVAIRADLERAVASLGPPGTTEREVWRLLYVEDRPIAEVAKMTGVPPGTVKSRAHRARQRLRASLAADGAAELGSQVMKGDAR